MMDPTAKPLDLDRKPKSSSLGDTIPPVSPPMATIKDDDELLLARIGYKQVRAPAVSHGSRGYCR
jgi:hypothetical protein